MRDRRLLSVLLGGLLLIILACGTASIFGTTSRQASVCTNPPILRTTFGFREEVTIDPYRVTMRVGYDVPVGTPSGQQLVLVTIRWHTPITATAPVSISYHHAVRITAIDTIQSGWEQGDWRVDSKALALRAHPLPDTIEFGRFHTIPILTPMGDVEEVELVLQYIGPPDNDPDHYVHIRFARWRTPVTCP